MQPLDATRLAAMPDADLRRLLGLLKGETKRTQREAVQVDRELKRRRRARRAT